jgi:hypothetical protein
LIHVQQTSSKTLPSTVILAIVHDRVCILEPKNKEILQTIEYSDISQIGTSEHKFVLMFGEDKKLRFVTPLGQMIRRVIEAYIKIKAL